ncbi:uncharacterized protein C8Q71DRAFT_754139 [Rhodofomes roseus]|uniref:C2 domain-containing protein n=1 Tax=Rhodofomes roseus TaxID=34475 RepID=A0ABQ8KIA3_9APHY|nr:uncharacterized protein C8Q71DRAFT_754139 [Rhodofomes roseus]KAH9837722.1 hypothetical protein C8Q71DRAFT_754139 [Rhodofomes roseus]
MSRRSYAGSVHHERRGSKFRVSDEDLMNYVFRVAYLSYQLQPKPVEVHAEEEAKTSDYSARIQGALHNSIFSIGDLFKDLRDGQKSVKFPKDLLKVLEQKLQNIAMGKDPAYSDQLTRRTMAVFYGQVKDENFRRQMKENRKIEELILMFATNATNVLKKEPSLAGDGWKLEVNNHIAYFIRLLRECMRQVSHVPPELTARLDMYAAKLTPSQAPSDSGYDSSSTRDSMVSPKRVSQNISDMPLLLTAAHLFKLPESAIQQEMQELGKYCTPKAALTDLKTCLKNINAGAAFPGRREDFESEAAWQYWRTLETSHLSQLMLVMVQINPEIAKGPSSTPPPSAGPNGRPGSIYSQRSTRPDSFYAAGTSQRHASISSRHSLHHSNSITADDFGNIGEEVDGDEDIPVGHHFTFIPPNPRKYYKRLLEHCLLADLEAMLSPSVGDDDEVSLGILSGTHIELINEVALRWRIGQPYRVTCFLDLVRQFYERNEVPLECIPEALQNIQKVLSEVELEKWPMQDHDYLAQVYGSLFSIFLSSLYHAMEAIPNLKQSEVAPYIHILEVVRASGLLEKYDVDVAARIADVQEQVRTVAARYYGQKREELHATPGVNKALPHLLMTDEIEKAAKLLDKRFPEPLLGYAQLDIVSLVVDIQVPHFIMDLDDSRKRLFEDSMNGPTPDVPIQDIFALYRRTKTLLAMHKAFVPNGEIQFDLGGFFQPYVQQWLVNTDNKTAQWVQAAIDADKFQPEGSEGHSSSIIDLFDSLRSPITFLEELEWSDEYQEARFFTSLSKTISKAIDQYCRSVEELFMTEMFPRPTDHLQPQKSSAWLERARQLAAVGEKKVEAFTFQPESCVKLNNVEAARRLLDQMYVQMQADKKAEVLQQVPPVPEKAERTDRFLFTAKICIAEGLVPLDTSPSSKLDTFVTLSDEQGHRLAKTRTIYETLSPRWDETFDISVEKPLWLMVSVRDRALVGKHDTVGRAYICLDPRRYGDFLTHDQWMDLDSTGRILLRISMEGEKDDLQFYFGRAFRSLKRAESDMVRVFIDKVSPFIRQCLSRTVLKTLVKSASGSIDYNKALGNVTALFGQALGQNNAEVMIPLPQSEKPRIRPEALTDMEIEQAIAPLFDYLDAILPTFNTYLSESTKEMVMTRVWKEILNVIEGLLIPPLSDISSDMKPLSDKEVDIVFKWLKFLRDYFYAGGEGPVPLESLQNQKYRDVLSIRLYYDWHTDALMEECVRMMQQSLRASPAVKKRAKSVYQQRNLGTIKKRKKEKQEEKEVNNGETILRILRMRPGTSDFIAQQLHAMTSLQAEREAQEQEAARRKAARPRQGQHPSVPAIPPLPPLPPKSPV